MEKTDKSEFKRSQSAKSLLLERRSTKLSRMIDNHFDEEVHEGPWIAPGIFPFKMHRYEHNDSGLAMSNIKIEKLKTFKELWEKNESIEKKQKEFKGFRNFREYEDIQEEDVILTIEYQTSQVGESQSTRHDDLKYFELAKYLKSEILKNFSMIKVYLKPLLYDTHDHSIETMFLRRRLGAFEVQIVSRINGDIKQDVIFSKIKTKQWPNINQIIKEIPKFLRRTSFKVKLQFVDSKPTSAVQNQNSLQFNEENDQKKISNVLVILRVFRTRTTQAVQNLNSSQHISQSRSKELLRNQSCVLSKSKRIKSAKQRTKDTSKVNNNEDQQKQEVQQVYQIPTDAKGQVNFINIPVDIYELTINETNNFQEIKKIVNLYEYLQENRPLEQTLLLVKPSHSIITIKIICEKEIERQTQTYQSNLKKSQKDLDKEREREKEKEIEFIKEARVEIRPVDIKQVTQLKENKQKSGFYEGVIEIGQYQVFVKKVGFKVFQSEFSAKAGESTFTFVIQKADDEKSGFDPVQEAIERKKNWKPLDEDEKKKPKFLKPPSVQTLKSLQSITLLQIQIKELIFKTVVPDVWVKVVDKDTQKICQYRTNLDGIVRITLLNAKSIQVSLVHPDYYPQIQDLDDNYWRSKDVITYEIIKKPIDDQETHILLQQGNQDPLSLYHMTDEQISHDIEQIQSISLYKTKPSQVRQSVKIFTLIKDLQKFNESNNIQKLLILKKQELIKVNKDKKESDNSDRPYVWFLGSILLPYGNVYIVNEIFSINEIQNLPTFIIEQRKPLRVNLIQNNILIFCTDQKGIYLFNTDEYKEYFFIDKAHDLEIIAVEIISDFLFVTADISGNIKLWKYDDERFQVSLVQELKSGQKIRQSSKFTNDLLLFGDLDGNIIVYSIKNNIKFESINRVFAGEMAVDQILSLGADHYLVLASKDAENLKTIKIERQLDKPISVSIVKADKIEKLKHIQVANLEFRTLVCLYDDLPIIDGFRLDKMTKVFSIGGLHLNIGSLCVIENGLISIGNDQKIVFYDQDLKVEKQISLPYQINPNIFQYFQNETKIVTQSKNGKLLIYENVFYCQPEVRKFVKQQDFPMNIVPQSNEVFFILTSKLPQENIQFQCITVDGSLISESNEYISFVRESNYQGIKLLSDKCKDIIRVCIRIFNTELYKKENPEMYYITSNHFNLIQQIQQMPINKKLTYSYLVGSLIYPYDKFHLINYMTENDTIRKVPSAEFPLHKGTINNLMQFNATEFITAGEDKNIIIWDQASLTPKITIPNSHSDAVTTLFKLTDDQFFSASRGGDIKLWKRVNPIVIQTIKTFLFHDPGMNLNAIVTIENNATLISSGDDRKLNVINLASGLLELLENVDQTTSLVRYQKDGFAAGFSDGRIKVWKKEKQSNKIVIKQMGTINSPGVASLTLFTPTLVLVTTMEKTVELYNMDTRARVKIYKDGHSSQVNSVVFFKNYLVSGGQDSRLVIWNKDTGKVLKTFENQDEEVKGLLLHQDQLITIGTTGKIKVWQDIVVTLKSIYEEDERIKREKAEQEKFEEEQKQLQAQQELALKQQQAIQKAKEQQITADLKNEKTTEKPIEK